MKTKTRKIIINKEEWVWIVQTGNFGQVSEVRIYNPKKTMYRIKPSDISSEIRNVGIEGDMTSTIKPNMIKSYITKNLIK